MRFCLSFAMNCNAGHLRLCFAITVWFARWLALACFLAATGSLPSKVNVDNPTGRPLPHDVSFSADPMRSQDFMRGTGLVSFAEGAEGRGPRVISDH
jgi:hypothetical protein